MNQVLAVAVHRAASRQGKKLVVGAAVTWNVGVLFVFKYYDFFASSFQNALADVGVHVSPGLIGVALPVGISFFTFMALSYVIDVYRGDFAPAAIDRSSPSSSRSSPTSSPARSSARASSCPQLGDARATRGASTRAARSS